MQCRSHGRMNHVVEHSNYFKMITCKWILFIDLITGTVLMHCRKVKLIALYCRFHIGEDLLFDTIRARIRSPMT